ncbi:MAG TPA: zinc ribbon domain-containing protein [Chthoniobacteraceae bacterium]|jgi:hypothetical protein|nr:zinc ribbon domain-containing protein [Chthoniobacteraceae bacterium]
MAPTPTLTCKQCNYENEPERVYCHNCGAKLDRTLLPKEPAKVTQESQEKARKRVQKLVNPARGFFTNWHKMLFNSLASAISIAALVQIARPPQGVPPVPTKEDIENASEVLSQMQELQLSSVQEPPQALSQKRINDYLAGQIHAAADTSGDYYKFERAFTNLGKGVIRITADVSAFGYHFYAGSSYKIAIVGGKLVSTNVGGNLGRLPVHPMIMTYCGVAFQHLWDALQRERDVMNKMQSVTVQPGGVTFVAKPHG